MQEHFKIPTDGKVISSPPRKCLLPLVFLLKLLGRNLPPRKEVTA